eukprot:CAMPEP_0206488746 /NCGR_PEP_ID=MMETSP0324_2-20121206/42648_1 /ASSEMBLY_ACC=CAM_ASM_000836 /TAXON_ID=2866 /ORGANISM="Crypthecodinium cohnii, Strain Seligo" /LENGTH=411 /DNA_ID=CAMNT_0053967933 /DNA_START=25 /DNA_END=1260 /DNA_ORIENTATION=-
MATRTMGGGASPTIDELMHKFDQLKGSSDAEGLAAVTKELAEASPSPEQLGSLWEATSALIRSARDGTDKVVLGYYLVASSEVLIAQENIAPALESATEALEILRSAPKPEAIATALDITFRAHYAQGNANAGLRQINSELSTLRSVGDRSREATVLSTLARAHALLGEPLSAIGAAEKAVNLNRKAGQKDAEGSSLCLIAEMRWALGELPAATEAARQALAAYSAAGDADGEKKAKAIISSTLARRGQIDKAPNRKEAKQALRSLASAVEQRNVVAAKEAEEQLNTMRDLVTDREIVEALQPLLQKDESAVKFLKELGWDFGDGDHGVDSALRGKEIPHLAFYLGQLWSGMNFGPQFRSVHPWRKGQVNKDREAIAVVQLPETEAWQMELGFRPGEIDAPIQSLLVHGFP